MRTLNSIEILLINTDDACATKSDGVSSLADAPVAIAADCKERNLIEFRIICMLVGLGDMEKKIKSRCFLLHIHLNCQLDFNFS